MRGTDSNTLFTGYKRGLLTALLVFITGLLATGQTITTDKDDYPPGGTVYITGNGFYPGETVTLQVIRINSPAGPGEDDSPWDVGASASGEISSTWQVCDYYCLGATFRLIADGRTSGLHAETTFTDAGIAQVSVGSQTGMLGYGTAAAAAYTVSVTGSGSPSAAFTTTVGVTGLPAGVSPSYSGDPTLVFTGTSPTTKTLTLTLTTSNTTPAGSYTFTVTTSGTTKTGTGALLIGKKELTITGVAANNKTYDATTAATLNTAAAALSGVVNSDAVTLNSASATGSFSDKNIGINKTVTASGFTLGGANAGNYTLTQPVTTGNITPLLLTGNITASNKVYDGNASATIASRTLSGVLGRESVSYAGGTASFDNRNAGTGKTVTATGLSLTGADAGNYTVNATATTTANITPLTLSCTVQVSNKVYDGNTTATITNRTLSGILGGDDVSCTGGTAVFNNKNVGTGKKVTVTGLVLAGANAGNYSAPATATANADITPLAITGSITAANKVYDGNTAATITGRALSGVIGADVVSYQGGTATFDNKNAGSGKTVTATGLSLGGADAANYSVNSTATTTADITALALTGSITAANKVYDGNTSATITNCSLSGVIGADEVSCEGGTATFDNKNAGTGKVVTATGLSLSGADAGNYSVNTTATATADITALAITGSIAAANKVYDGNTSAAITNRILAGVIGDDAVSYIAGTATFDNKNAGTGKTVTATGLSLSGADAANYSVNTAATTTADITALALTGSITAANKVYDGNTSAVITGRSLSGIIGDDTVSCEGGIAAFDNKNAGTGKAVTATGLSLSGVSAGNYSVNTTATTTADITPRSVSVTADAKSKLYGAVDPAFTYQVTSGSVVAGDNFSGALVRDEGETVGTYAIGQGLLTLGSNYTLGYTGAVFTISPVTVTSSVSVSPTTKQYSDLVSLAATITGGAPKFSGGPQAATSVTFKIGTQTIGTAALVASGSDLVATLSNVPLTEPAPFGTAPAGQMAPGNSTVTAVINSADANYSINNMSPTGSLGIAAEDARVEYTGTQMMSTSCATCNTATVTLRATIKDVSAVPGDASFDSNAGDIRNAKVTFINRDDNTVIASNIPVTLLATDPKTGTASYSWNVDLGSWSAQTYTIGVIVSGYYTRNDQSDNSVVQVYKPGVNAVTGGGHLLMSNSTGTKKGDPGTRNNFGFNIKSNKSGSSLQGNINIIVRRVESDGKLHTYQVKGNSMTYLSVNNSTKQAVFKGKASIQDITNPLSPVSIEGNATLQVNMTDKDETGTTDMILMVVKDKNGNTWFCSHTDATLNATEKTLAGGNIKVNNSSVNQRVAEDDSTAASSADVFKVYPNPNDGTFVIEVCSSNVTAGGKIDVVNSLGQVVYSKALSSMNGCIKENLTLDSSLPDGNYIVMLTIGNEVTSSRLVLAK